MLMSKEKPMADLGISKIEMAIILPGLRKRLKRSLPYGNLDPIEGLRTVAWLCKKISKASNKEYQPLFMAWEHAMNKTADLLVKEDIMAKFELGITMGEITGMLPELLAEAWASYNDDKKISVDEGILFVSVVLDQMAKAADDTAVKDFFVAQSAALAALAPFFVEEEVVEPE